MMMVVSSMRSLCRRLSRPRRRSGSRIGLEFRKGLLGARQIARLESLPEGRPILGYLTV